MRLSLSSLFYKSPFENLQKHADKVKECAKLFMEASACHINADYEKFELLTDHVARLESEADDIKRNIRNHQPYGILMPVDKFQFFLYVKEQDNVMDDVEEALFWLSFRQQNIKKEVAADFQQLVESVIKSVEKLPELVRLAAIFFRTRSEENRKKVKSIIYDIRQGEHEADLLERELKAFIFKSINNAIEVFYLIRLVEKIGEIADHAENAADRMRGMIAR